MKNHSSSLDIHSGNTRKNPLFGPVSDLLTSTPAKIAGILAISGALSACSATLPHEKPGVSMDEFAALQTSSSLSDERTVLGGMDNSGRYQIVDGTKVYEASPVLGGEIDSSVPSIEEISPIDSTIINKFETMLATGNNFSLVKPREWSGADELEALNLFDMFSGEGSVVINEDFIEGVKKSGSKGNILNDFSVEMNQGDKTVELGKMKYVSFDSKGEPIKLEPKTRIEANYNTQTGQLETDRSEAQLLQKQIVLDDGTIVKFTPQPANQAASVKVTKFYDVDQALDVSIGFIDGQPVGQAVFKALNDMHTLGIGIGGEISPEMLRLFATIGMKAGQDGIFKVHISHLEKLKKLSFDGVSGTQDKTLSQNAIRFDYSRQTAFEFLKELGAHVNYVDAQGKKFGDLQGYRIGVTGGKQVAAGLDMVIALTDSTRLDASLSAVKSTTPALYDTKASSEVGAEGSAKLTQRVTVNDTEYDLSFGGRYNTVNNAWSVGPEIATSIGDGTFSAYAGYGSDIFKKSDLSFGIKYTMEFGGPDKTVRKRPPLFTSQSTPVNTKVTFADLNQPVGFNKDIVVGKTASEKINTAALVSSISDVTVSNGYQGGTILNATFVSGPTVAPTVTGFAAAAFQSVTVVGNDITFVTKAGYEGSGTITFNIGGADKTITVNGLDKLAPTQNASNLANMTNQGQVTTASIGFNENIASVTSVQFLNLLNNPTGGTITSTIAGSTVNLNVTTPNNTPVKIRIIVKDPAGNSTTYDTALFILL